VALAASIGPTTTGSTPPGTSKRWRRRSSVTQSAATSASSPARETISQIDYYLRRDLTPLMLMAELEAYVMKPGRPLVVINRRTGTAWHRQLPPQLRADTIASAAKPSGSSASIVETDSSVLRSSMVCGRSPRSPSPSSSHICRRRHPGMTCEKTFVRTRRGGARSRRFRAGDGRRSP